MSFTTQNIKESLLDALQEVDNTNIDEYSIHYLHGYLTETIRQTIAMIERMEKDEKYEQYRAQEEKEFLSHLGKF